MTSMHSRAVAIAPSIGHFTAQLRGAHPNPVAPVSFLSFNRLSASGLRAVGAAAPQEQVMPSASFNHREPAAGTVRARVSDGEIFIDPAARREIESADQPLWGQFHRMWESLA